MALLLPVLIVGCLWGITNPLVKRGSEVADRKRISAHSTAAPPAGGFLRRATADWVLLLSTPAFILPHLANLSGSALFVTLLGKGVDIARLVPAANAVALAANAVMDLLLGERYRLALLLPGLALVATGVLLCSS